MFPELTRKPHPTHEQSRYSFSSVHNVELGNLMKEEEEEESSFLHATNFHEPRTQMARVDNRKGVNF